MPKKTVVKKEKVTKGNSKRTTKVVKAISKKQSPSVVVASQTASSSLFKLQAGSKKKIGIFLSIFIVLALLYYFRSWFIVAIVNGQPLSRFSLDQELEKQSGKQVLDLLITKTLLVQKANKEHVTVSQDDINKEVARISDSLKERKQNLDEVLAAQGMTKDGFIEQIKLQKMAEKVVDNGITVSDKEVKDYMEKNKETLPANTKAADIKEKIKSDKVNEKISTLLQQLRDSARINYFVSF